MRVRVRACAYMHVRACGINSCLRRGRTALDESRESGGGALQQSRADQGARDVLDTRDEEQQRRNLLHRVRRFGLGEERVEHAKL